MAILYLLFTADHEIFFGENYQTEKELLIDTTYRLMDILKHYGIPLTLMTDVCSIFRYRELGMHDYPYLMEEQLRYAMKTGHDVQLHLHPHWTYSMYTDGKWSFDQSRYRLHDFGFDENDKNSADSIISRGKNYLENLLQPIDPDYRCIAFRAGGWCLQPEKALIRSLLNHGMAIDTSVYKGGYQKNDTHYLDYRNVPKDTNWYIDPEIGLSKKGASGILEIPIGSISKKPYLYLQKFRNRSYRRKYLKTVIKGVPIGTKPQSFLRKLGDRITNLLTQPLMFTYDSATAIELMEFVSYYTRHLDYKNKDFYLSIIGHPKGLNDSNLREIDKFCRELLNHHDNNIRFTDYTDVYTRIIKRETDHDINFQR